MTKRRVLIWVSSVFGVLAIGAGIFVSTWDRNDAKKYVSAGISKVTGRELSIGGDLEVDLGWISRVRASQIQFENAHWSKHAQMVELDSIDVHIDLWQLFKGRLVLPTVVVSKPK